MKKLKIGIWLLLLSTQSFASSYIQPNYADTALNKGALVTQIAVWKNEYDTSRQQATMFLTIAAIELGIIVILAILLSRKRAAN